MERRAPLLEHHGDAPAADVPNLELGKTDQIDTVELDATGHDAATARLDKSQYRHRRHTFATTALTD
jgi:hypothetical protein